MLFNFGKRKVNAGYNELAGCIKDELTKIFQKKGIDIEDINIDIKSNSLNIQVYVGSQQGQTVSDCWAE